MPPSRPSTRLLGIVLGASLGVAGCGSIAADLAGSLLGGGTDTLRAYFDYESSGQAAANAILQLEALHGASPGNDTISLMLAKAYIAYAFGWVMDEHEAAYFERRDADAERHKQRAYWMYRRARDLALRVMRERDERIDEVLHGDPDVLVAYLRKEYDDPEDPDDIEPLLWCAVAWGSTINNAPSLDELIDLPIPKAFAEHVAALDPSYENGAALGLLGAFEASYPEAMGGDWEKGKAYFQRAIQLSRRRDHIHLFNYARTYAINALDKKLFLSLMREIADAPDLGNDVRLSNKVARRRAARYLAHLDEWFD